MTQDAAGALIVASGLLWVAIGIVAILFVPAHEASAPVKVGNWSLVRAVAAFFGVVFGVINLLLGLIVIV